MAYSIQQRICPKIATIAFGLLMIIFGTNTFLNFAPAEPPIDVTAQAFCGSCSPPTFWW